MSCSLKKGGNMNTYTITQKDLNENNEYIGDTDLSNYKGHIMAEEGLGYVRFRSLRATGRIYFEAGSGIEAGHVIEAGWRIRSGQGIKAGWGIEAGCGIKAVSGIEAGCGIKSGHAIEAGSGIKAGLGIKSGWGIKAGWGISCKTLQAGLRIFAGTCLYKLPTIEEKQIKCEELLSGEVCYGELVLVAPEKTTVTITVEGRDVEISRDSAKALHLIG